MCADGTGGGAAEPPPFEPFLQQLAAARVRTADGRRAGRVRDVYLCDRSGDLRAITVAAGRLRSRRVLVPARAIRLAVPPTVELGVDAAMFARAIAAPVTGHASAQLLRDAEAALGVADGALGGVEHATGDPAVPDPAVPAPAGPDPADADETREVSAP